MRPPTGRSNDVRQFASASDEAILWAGRFDDLAVLGPSNLARIQGLILADRTSPALPVELKDRVVVGDIELGLLQEGDLAWIDGDRGTVDLRDVEETHVVTSFLQRDDGRILLLKRSDRVGSFRGCWAAVSGFLEDPTPIAQAIREIEEETGVHADALTRLREGEPILARGENRIYEVHPFLFRVHDPKIQIDWEHSESEWVDPTEIPRRVTVPKLDAVWAAVRTVGPSGGEK